MYQHVPKTKNKKSFLKYLSVVISLCFLMSAFVVPGYSFADNIQAQTSPLSKQSISPADAQQPPAQPLPTTQPPIPGPNPNQPVTPIPQPTSYSNSCSSPSTSYVSGDCYLISINNPNEAIINGTNVVATVEGTVYKGNSSSITIDANVSVGASWKLYSNSSCSPDSELTSKTMVLSAPVTTAYVKVTSEGAINSLVYTLNVLKVNTSGDLNNDGVVDSSDLSVFQDYLLHKTQNIAFDNNLSDLNLDGAVNVSDYSLMRKFLNKKISALPFTNNNQIVCNCSPDNGNAASKVLAINYPEINSEVQYNQYKLQGESGWENYEEPLILQKNCYVQTRSIDKNGTVIASGGTSVDGITSDAQSPISFKGPFISVALTQSTVPDPKFLCTLIPDGSILPSKTNFIKLLKADNTPAQIIVAGAVTKLSDIKPGDVLYYSASSDNSIVEIQALRNNTSGLVTGIDAASGNILVNNKYSINSMVNTNYFSIGASYSFKLDKSKRIISAYRLAAPLYSEEYGFVVATRYSNEDGWFARIRKLDNSLVDVKTTQDYSSMQNMMAMITQNGDKVSLSIDNIAQMSHIDMTKLTAKTVIYNLSSNGNIGLLNNNALSNYNLQNVPAYYLRESGSPDGDYDFIVFNNLNLENCINGYGIVGPSTGKVIYNSVWMDVYSVFVNGLTRSFYTNNSIVISPYEAFSRIGIDENNVITSIQPIDTGYQTGPDLVDGIDLNAKKIKLKNSTIKTISDNASVYNITGLGNSISSISDIYVGDTVKLFENPATGNIDMIVIVQKGNGNQPGNMGGDANLALDKVGIIEQTFIQNMFGNALFSFRIMKLDGTESVIVSDKDYSQYTDKLVSYVINNGVGSIINAVSGASGAVGYADALDSSKVSSNTKFYNYTMTQSPSDGRYIIKALDNSYVQEHLPNISYSKVSYISDPNSTLGQYALVAFSDIKYSVSEYGILKSSLGPTIVDNVVYDSYDAYVNGVETHINIHPGRESEFNVFNVISRDCNGNILEITPATANSGKVVAVDTNGNRILLSNDAGSNVYLLDSNIKIYNTSGGDVKLDSINNVAASDQIKFVSDVASGKIVMIIINK